MKAKQVLTNSQILLRLVVRGDQFRVKEFLQEKLELTPQELGRILWYAEQRGNLKIAKLLIKVGADLTVTNPFDKSHPSFLHDLILRKQSKFHKLAIIMIENGADVNARTEFGNVLDYAMSANNRSIDLIEELIKRGVCVKGLMYKVFCERSYEHSKLIEQLLKRNSPIVQTTLKRAAEEMLHLNCSLDNEWQSVFERVRSVNLQLAGRRLSAYDMKNFGSVFEAAIAKDLYELMEPLIEYGLDVNKPTANGQFPLHAAAKLRESRITELLIQSRAEVHSLSKDTGRSALHVACQHNSIENIRVLLRHGLDINLTDNDGRTPFSLINTFFVIHDTHRLFIKLLAVFVSHGKKINDYDLEMIEANVSMHEYYMQCMSELMEMKDIQIMNKFSLLSILDKDVKKLLFTSRSYNFVKKLNSKRWRRQFPIFHEKMDAALKNIEKQKILLSERDNAVYESLKYILPVVPLEIILYYLYFDGDECTKYH